MESVAVLEPASDDANVAGDPGGCGPSCGVDGKNGDGASLVLLLDAGVAIARTGDSLADGAGRRAENRSARV